jgi:hypothetical protein
MNNINDLKQREIELKQREDKLRAELADVQRQIAAPSRPSTLPYYLDGRTLEALGDMPFHGTLKMHHGPEGLGPPYSHTHDKPTYYGTQGSTLYSCCVDPDDIDWNWCMKYGSAADENSIIKRFSEWNQDKESKE